MYVTVNEICQQLKMVLCPINFSFTFMRFYFMYFFLLSLFVWSCYSFVYSFISNFLHYF